MRKLIYLLLLAVVVPFTQSCNSSSDSAKDSFLATLRSDGSKFGFMCVLDNMKTAEVTDLKGTYKHTDGDRVMIYGNLNKNTGASGYDYTVDIHQIAKIITDDVKTVSTPEDDVYGNIVVSKLPDGSYEFEDDQGGFPELFPNLRRLTIKKRVHIPNSIINELEGNDDMDITKIKESLTNLNTKLVSGIVLSFSQLDIVLSDTHNILANSN